jgi:hypothetical protein
MHKTPAAVTPSSPLLHLSIFLGRTNRKRRPANLTIATIRCEPRNQREKKTVQFPHELPAKNPNEHEQEMRRKGENGQTPPRHKETQQEKRRRMRKKPKGK